MRRTGPEKKTLRYLNLTKHRRVKQKGPLKMPQNKIFRKQRELLPECKVGKDGSKSIPAEAISRRLSIPRR